MAAPTTAMAAATLVGIGLGASALASVVGVLCGGGGSGGSSGGSGSLSSGKGMVPRAIPDFLTAEECEAVIREAHQKGFKRSGVISKERPISAVRTSENVFLDPGSEAEVAVVEKIERLTGIPRAYFENLQVVKYEPGQRYDAHYDPCMRCDDGKDILRTQTVMMFLNDVDEGGGTSFPNLGLLVMPARGKAVWWKNMEGGRILPESLHSGTPVVRGVKYACQIWIRKDTFRPPPPPPQQQKKSA